MKVSIIIAIYNEAPTVATLLECVWAQPIPGAGKELVIVESNSRDGSRALVAQFLGRHAGDGAAQIQVIHQARPQGKGHAVRQGLAAATGEILLVQDADLEYDVADYPALLKPILEGRATVVLGSRHMGPRRWRIRQFARRPLQAVVMNVGSLLFHAFFNAVFGTRLSDPTSMYKVFRASCIEGLQFRCNRFDFDFELLGKLIRAGHVPLEIPVAYRSRGFDEGKKIRIWRDPLSWLLAILTTRFAPLRRAPQRAGRRARGELRYSEKPAPRASL